MENKKTKNMVSIVIPTLNEASGIKKTIGSIPIETLRKMGFDTEIIVVDGGSTDGTDRIAKELGARIVYEFRRGYGRAYKTGFSEARGDIIVTLDGDGSYPSEYIPQLIKFLIENELDMVIGQRIPKQGAMSKINALGNYILTMLIKMLFRIDIKDSQSGMWVIMKDVLKDIMPRGNGMEFSEEIKIKAYFCRNRVKEFPIPYRKRLGEVKLRRFRDGIRNLLYIFVIFLHSHFGKRCYE